RILISSVPKISNKVPSRRPLDRFINRAGGALEVHRPVLAANGVPAGTGPPLVGRLLPATEYACRAVAAENAQVSRAMLLAGKANEAAVTIEPTPIVEGTCACTLLLGLCRAIRLRGRAGPGT